MIDFDRWQEIFQSIKKHKLRAALTAFGVFWGIFMLVVLMGAGKGLENGTTSSFDIAKNAVFVWTQRTSVPYKGLQPGRFIILKNGDIDAIKQQVPEVDVIVGTNQLGGNFSIERQNYSASFAVSGDFPEFLKIKPLIITSGRFINQNDMDQRRKIVVIGKRVKEVLFPEGSDPVGQLINIKDIPFKVVGVFESSVRGEDGIQDVQTIHMPMTTMQTAFNMGENVAYLAMIPEKNVPARAVEDKVRALLARRHVVAPEDKRAFGSANVEEEYKQIQMIFTGIRGFSWLVAIGTIIAGVVGVGNIMMIIVKERTREIGIRKSVGATPWSIIVMILQEALVLTSLAGYLGLIAGCALVAGIKFLLSNFGLESEFFANPEINFTTAFTAIIVLIVAGIVAGLIPGIRAANVNPVIALRGE